MIELSGVTFKYPRAKAPVLSNLSAAFPKGAITALTGPNGCGKTTLTKLMVGMLRPSAGRITVDGDDLAPLDLFQIGRRVGYLFQNPDHQLFCDTVENEIAYGLKNLSLPADEIKATVARYLARFHLTPLAESFPGTLSRGEKQRVALSAVLALGTGYLVLDEPTTGLDLRARRELGSLLTRLRDEGDCGIILVSHERGFIDAYADREWVMP